MHSIKTIAAIATPLIPSAIGILRVSGPDAKNVTNRLFKTKIKPNNYRKMITATITQDDGKILDQCCYAFYKGPHSYTGEDVLEIFCHGSTYIVRELLQIITAMPDCMLAKNGEFTQRAFINGKIPLSKAEAILDIIESTSEGSHKIAMNQFTGHVHESISNCRDHAITLLQKIEASLEFPDDVEEIKNQVVSNDCSEIIKILTPIIKASDYGAIIKKGLKYLIVGEPNVGKSSLLNKLSGESRSIVSETEGTTRDYIDISIEYNGIIITLIDTAGIRETSSNVEKIGIEKIKELSVSADGYILVTDGTSSKPFNWPDFLDQTKPIIEVKNKIDLKSSKTGEQLGISCKTGAGLTELKEMLVNTFVDQSQYEPHHMLCNIRQITALNNAYHYIKKHRNTLNQKQRLILSPLTFEMPLTHSLILWGTLLRKNC